MNISHPSMYLDHLHMKQDEIEQVVIQSRLVAEAQRGQPQRNSVVRSWIGHALVRIGQWLERADRRAAADRPVEPSAAVCIAR